MYAPTTRHTKAGGRPTLRGLRTHSSFSSGYEADLESRDSQKVLLPHSFVLSAAGSRRETMAVPNFSRRVLSSNQGQGPIFEHGQINCEAPPSRKSPCRRQGIKRWNGQTRTYSDWDCLRRVCSSPGPCQNNADLHIGFRTLGCHR